MCSWQLFSTDMKTYRYKRRQSTDAIRSRYLILMPYSDPVALSQRIESNEERSRNQLKQFRPSINYRVRTLHWQLKVSMKRP